MAQYAPPKQFRTEPTVFMVGQDIYGRWMVQENHGLVEGTFISREDAVRFAESERTALPAAFVMVTPERIVPYLGR